MEHEEFEALIKQARGDPEEFAHLYDIFYHKVYGYVAKRIPSLCDAVDVAQQVFEKNLVGIDRFDPSRASFQ